ncbi:hypothetical protein QZH41_002829 [Actinostola sp. cb2023]|nr:hypothetical protein QZH41_002829 [Actinostola sp. cb2023]
MRDNESYRRLETAAKERPLLSLFLGSFLTTSAIPLIVFLFFVFGTFMAGIFAFAALQGGVVFIASMILCACLVAPLFLSSAFALVVFCTLSAMRAIGGLISQSVQVPADTHGRNPVAMRIWNNMATRVRAITNSSHFLEHASGIPANIESTGEGNGDSTGYTGLAQMAYNILRNQNGGPQPQVSEATGSALRNCAERHARRRYTSPALHRDPSPDSPRGLPNMIPLSRITDSDDESLPILLRAPQEPDDPAQSAAFDRRVPSPSIELSFDFFTSPSRAVDAHSASLKEVQDNLRERVEQDVTGNSQEKTED